MKLTVIKDEEKKIARGMRAINIEVEDGKDGTLTFSAFERCKGSFVKVVKATDAVDVNTTFLVNNEKITYPRKNAEGMEETVESQAKAGILNGETKVWSPTLKDDKGQKLSWTKIKELPPNSVLAKQLNLIMSTIAPDDIAPTVVTTYDISVDGIAAPINYTKETLTKAIADGNGTLNKETASFVFIDPITQAKSYKKVMENSELLKIFNSASGVQPITAERKSTGIPELDVWLKGEIGSGWDKLTDPKQKESMYDSFEKTDPTIKKLTDQYKKQKIRSALGMSADTGLGRGLQNLRGKVGAAITGNQPQV